MDWKTLAGTGGAVMLAVSLACTSSPATAPSETTTTFEGAVKVSAPTVQSPVNNQQIGSLTPTLSATAATGQYTPLTLQYRFQVLNDSGVIAQDSGVVGGPSWTTTQALTPNSLFTWRVRAEYQGAAGPWSASGSFTTPDPPPPFPGPIGDWQACAPRTDKADLVSCVWDAVRPTNSVGDLEVSKRVAWLLRGEGAGLLIKNGGENIVLWQGYSFSASRICYPDGHIYKLISDAGPGGANTPVFTDNGFVDPTLYVPAIDPSKP
jgi:hypothetical protein